MLLLFSVELSKFANLWQTDPFLYWSICSLISQTASLDWAMSLLNSSILSLYFFSERQIASWKWVIVGRHYRFANKKVIKINSTFRIIIHNHKIKQNIHHQNPPWSVRWLWSQESTEEGPEWKRGRSFWQNPSPWQHLLLVWSCDELFLATACDGGHRPRKVLRQYPRPDLSLSGTSNSSKHYVIMIILYPWICVINIVPQTTRRHGSHHHSNNASNI